jgi:hypothetical protein
LIFRVLCTRFFKNAAEQLTSASILNKTAKPRFYENWTSTTFCALRYSYGLQFWQESLRAR